MLSDMENTRRPFDNRSREPGFKKPRLAEDLVPNPNGRPFPKRTNPVGPASTLRFRASDSETDELNRGGGGGYEPQPLSQQQLQQQQHELVSQYKTALAELTFNSKPIITNLTIIAGENTHAAKAIAGAVCANIIEVPSDQKLPSLYLLDSIVKNIGRDYAKHFAPKLPEVFCKAYRQVDPPVRQSMRHLFGTWKGVFPLQCLQVIEKDLAFSPLANGSSSGTTTSRPDPLSQRQPHSIHVNPKYLEKQRLQQSSREKDMVNDMTDSKDSERPPDRATVATGRPSIDPSVKMNTPGMGVGRTSGKVADQGQNRTSYGGTRSVPELISSQRNGFDIKRGSQNYSASKPVIADPRLQAKKNVAGRSNIGLSSSWKNSEEEEFMWDMHSRLSEHDAVNVSNNSRKDPWTTNVSEKLDFKSQFRKAQSVHDVGPLDRETSDMLSTEQNDEASYGRRNLSVWPLQESHKTDGLPSTSLSHLEGYSSTIGGLSTGASASLARIGMRPKVGSSLGTSGFGILSPKLAEQDYPQAHSSGKLNHGPLKHSPQASSASVSSFQSSHYYPFSTPPQPESVQSEPSGQSQKQLLSKISEVGAISTMANASKHTNPLAIGTSELSSTSSLLAAVMKSGILSSNSFTGTNEISQDAGKMASLLSLPNGPPDFTTSGNRVSGSPSYDSIAATTNNSQGKVEQPPLPPGLSPLVSDVPLQTSDADSKASIPVSNLLSSLVAKGLISAAKKDASSLPSVQMPTQMQQKSQGKKKNPTQSLNKNLDISTSSSLSASPDASSSLVPRSSAMDEVSFARPATKSSTALHKSTSKKDASSLPSVQMPTQMQQKSQGMEKKPTQSLNKNLDISTSSSLSASPDASSSLVPRSSTMDEVSFAKPATKSSAASHKSTSKKDASSLPSAQMPTQMQQKSQGMEKKPTQSLNKNLDISTSSTSSLSASHDPSSPVVPRSSTMDEVSFAKPTTKTSAASHKATSMEVENLIGTEFRPDIIKEFHSSVISELLDDLLHCCSLCGLRLKLQEQLDRHLEWHAMRKTESEGSDKALKGWYAMSDDWIAGKAGQLVFKSAGSVNQLEKTTDEPELMVPADENQYACILCGELFEDYFSQNRGEWMFNGAVYLDIPSKDGEVVNGDASAENGPIVHANCMSERSAQDSGLAGCFKMEMEE